MPSNKRSSKSTGEKQAKPASSDISSEAFAFFTEIGIINQLSTNMLAHSLPNGVHPSHFAIVNHLTRRGDGRTPLAIAQAMQVTKTTMSHSLKVLEKQGFITLKSNPDDARSKEVFLTDKGRKFRTRAMADVSKTFGPVLEKELVQKMQAMLPDLIELRMHLDKNRP